MAYKRTDRTVQINRFDAIEIGQAAELSHLLTAEDVQVFASLTGDYNPLHIDAEYAKKTMFQKPVVHGMLSASFISTMIGMLLPGGGALWMSQTIEFLRPAYVGDTIRVVATVKQKSVATRLLVSTIAVKNQHGEDLIAGEATVKMLEIENEEKTVSSNKKKTILITGGSRGIGAAAASRLASEGNAVIVNFANSKDAAEKVVAEITAAGGKAIALKANVSDVDEVKRLFASAEKAFGPVNAVVHCAAPENVPQPFENLDWDSFQAQIDVHLKGAFNCVQAALPKMVEANSGEFVFLGTIYTEGVPPVQQARYITAKSALTAFARCLAVEYGPKGIRANVVAPGMTETDMIAHLPDKVKMLAKMQTPLRKLAKPVDIANAIGFLLSSAAGHITGETLRVSGGL